MAEALTSGRRPDERELFYERFAGEFDEWMNSYEVGKRLRLVFDEALADIDLRGCTFLDAGCGTGLFTCAAVERGAHVTSLDIGPNLLAEVAKRCDSIRVVGDLLGLPFADDEFDVVLCTEAIEHTPSPRKAVAELARVLRVGGTLVLTTPNRIWRPALGVADALGLRPFEGLENWVGWKQVDRWLREQGLSIVDRRGFNALPFVHAAMYRLIDRLDSLGRTVLGRLMVNMLFVARKPARSAL